MVSKDYIVLMGHYFPKSEIRLGAFIVLLLASSAAVVFMMVWQRSDYNVSKSIANEVIITEEPEPEDRSLLEQLLAHHVEATSFSEVTSFKANGAYYSDNVAMEFTVLSRRPNLYRQNLETSDVTITYGYDGQAVWLEQSHPVIDEGKKELRILNEALVQLENSMPYLAWLYQNGDYETQLTLFPDHHIGEKIYAVVRSYSLLPFPVYHYIDRDTGLEGFRTADIPLGSAIKHIEVRYEYGNDSLPKAYLLYLDRELHARAEFTSLMVNEGVPSFVFNKPHSN